MYTPYKTFYNIQMELITTFWS